MSISKEEQFNLLISELSTCLKCTNITSPTKDKSLYNIYQQEQIGKSIPSIWTDWYNRLDAKIMVIGQDWGPAQDMLNLYEKYQKDKSDSNWKKIIEEENSSTKKKLEQYLITSSNGKISNIDNIYITNAIMCGRKGNSYRGDNINLKKSTLYCSKYLKRQIDIVKPKVILTLGYYPLLSLSQEFQFQIFKNLKETIKNQPIIKVDDYIIIPAYHPVAEISKEKQLKQYKLIWDYIE